MGFDFDKLYRYQRETIEKWRNVNNVLLGDEMGLGKTVTAIALDALRREQDIPEQPRRAWIGTWPKRTLVVTLKSLLGMWEEHFTTWNPSLKVMVVDTKYRASFVSAATDPTSPYQVFICHWDMLRLEPDLRRVRWLHKVADEVQKIKNRSSQVAIAFKSLHALYKTDMSGTWADNHPQDAWSVLNHLYPGTWNNYKRFCDYHLIQKKHSFEGCGLEVNGCKGHNPSTKPFKELLGVHDAEGLAERMAPFYLRRRKDQVLKDLPDKYYTRLGVDLSAQQRRAYDGMRREMLAWVGQHEDQPIAAPIVISQLVRLQQFAVAHGELVTEPKWNPQTEEYDQVRKLKLTEPSTKLDMAMEIIDMNPGLPLVFFSMSKQIINLFSRRLNEAGISHGVLTGDTPQQARTDLVRTFQNGETTVFAGTIPAGGVGITLTRASTVIFFDRAWSPSVNKQAEDRLHRIGQKNAVQVIDLIARNTIDMGRLQRLEKKWHWIKQILGDHGTSGLELSSPSPVRLVEN